MIESGVAIFGMERRETIFRLGSENLYLSMCMAFPGNHDGEELWA